MRPTFMPLSVILIGCLIATVLTLAFVPHRGDVAPKADLSSFQRL